MKQTSLINNRNGSNARVSWPALFLGLALIPISSNVLVQNAWALTDSVGTYGGDCLTAQNNYCFGTPVCAKAVFNGSRRRIEWVDSNNQLLKTSITTAASPLTDSFTPTAPGTYTIKSIRDSDDHILATSTFIVRPQPTAILSGDTEVCEGATAKLTLAVVGTGNLQGTLSDGTPFSGTAPTIEINVAPSATTTYTVATLGDDSCANSPAQLGGSALVIVRDLPAIQCPADITQYTTTPGQTSALVEFAPGMTDAASLTCTPASGSEFPLGSTTVTCTALNGCASVSCSFVVNVQVNHAPVLTNPGYKTATQGVLSSFKLVASDPDAGQSLTFAIVGGVQPGMTINPTTGDFAWTPTTASLCYVKVRVTDNGAPALSNEQGFYIAVNSPGQFVANNPPVLTNPGSKFISRNSTLSFTLHATDLDAGQILTYSIMKGSQPGMSLDPSTGDFSWTPTSSGIYTVKFRVADNGSPISYDEKGITILVTQ